MIFLLAKVSDNYNWKVFQQIRIPVRDEAWTIKKLKEINLTWRNRHRKESTERNSNNYDEAFTVEIIWCRSQEYSRNNWYSDVSFVRNCSCELGRQRLSCFTSQDVNRNTNREEKRRKQINSWIYVSKHCAGINLLLKSVDHVGIAKRCKRPDAIDIWLWPSYVKGWQEDDIQFGIIVLSW